MSKPEYLRQSLIIGWVSLLQLRVVLFVIALSRSAVANDFTSFAKDPGMQGTNIMIVLFALHALVPVLVRAFDGQVFRWIVAVISGFFLLFFSAHEISHLLAKDEMYWNLEKILDLSHLALMLWVAVCAIRWARLQEKSAACAA
jgi:hypothetical protein